MTYFGVLALFILPPLLILARYVPGDVWAWLRDHKREVDWRAYKIVLAHVVLALVYTTPWDNYLVASGVWWYDPQLVTGITLGWVPIEEYTFFILQTLMTGLWALVLQRRLAQPAKAFTPSAWIRWAGSATLLLMGAASLAALLAGWLPGRYMSLILIWAAVPVGVQVAFGGDILHARAGKLALTIVPPTLYLWAVDAFAIGSGTWTINPLQTTGIKFGVLPIEEMLFFFVTNLIIGCGVQLMLAEESQQRVKTWFSNWKSRPTHQSGNAETPEPEASRSPIGESQV